MEHELNWMQQGMYSIAVSFCLLWANLDEIQNEHTAESHGGMNTHVVHPEGWRSDVISAVQMI